MKLSWLLATAAMLLGLAAGVQAAQIVDIGNVQIGVDDTGDLNIPGPSSSGSSANDRLGLRYVPTNYEATAGGCDCEGWGASYDSMVGGTTTNSLVVGDTRITVESFEGSSGSAVSVTRLGDLRITHDFHASESADLVEVEVTLENARSTDMLDVRYRRVMDWDIEPTPFSEYVTIFATPSPDSTLAFSSNDGFASANPLTPGVQRNAVIGPPHGPNFEDFGPQDQGALFEFAFGTLKPGEKLTFWAYYGGSATEADALKAIETVKAEVYSLGQANTDPKGGTPNTFIFAFAGVVPIPPLPGFSWEPGQPYGGDPVTFVDVSEDQYGNNVAKSRWDFGDGTTADVDPWSPTIQHTYAPGTYDVELTVWDDRGLDASVMQRIRVLENAPPIPEFTFAPEVIGTITTVQFTDGSIDPNGDVVQWLWDFGGLETSIATNPTFQFPTRGIHDVTLTVWDDRGASASLTKPVEVTNLPPQAAFKVLGNRAAGVELTFRSDATDLDGEVVRWLWDLGDGTTSVLENPLHTFGSQGEFLVSLRVWDDEGAWHENSRIIRINGEPPSPAAQWSADGPSTSDQVHFWDASFDADGAVVAWAWDFGDGNHALDANPSHTYVRKGTYTVRLTVTDDAGLTASVEFDVLVPNQAPVPRFSVRDEGGTTYFIDESSDEDSLIETWDWDLGDGTTSTLREPAHRYDSSEATYRVILIVTDTEGGTGTLVQYITQDGAVAAAKPTPVEPPERDTGEVVMPPTPAPEAPDGGTTDGQPQTEPVAGSRETGTTTEPRSARPLTAGDATSWTLPAAALAPAGLGAGFALWRRRR